MTRDLYREIVDKFKPVAERLEDSHLEYASYGHGIQFNVKDMNGIIHSFYPSTGTMLFHRGNGIKYRKEIAVIRGGNLKRFMKLMRKPDEIQKLIDIQLSQKTEVTDKQMKLDFGRRD